MAASKMFLGSVLLNICALGALAYVASQRPTPLLTTAKENTSASTPGSPAAKGTDGSTTVSPSPAGFRWNTVESEDYRKYIANLRAIGCPEETIKDIIIADVTKLYAPKLAALNTQMAGPFRYWESRRNWGLSEEELARQKQRTAIEKEMAALIKELLGVDMDEERRKLTGSPDYNEWKFGFLDKDKREAAQKILKKYSELEQQIYRKSQGRMYPEDQEELKKINQDRQAELAQLLTPQELLEYNLRSSQTASQMNYDLASFSPNEDEFRKIFQLRSQFDDQYGRNYGGYDPDHPELAKERDAAQQKLNEDLKAALGDRYADYAKSQDFSYQELDRVAKRYDLPPGAADKVYAMKQTAEQAVAKIRQDTSLTSDQRTAALQAVRTETETAAQEALGERGFKSYKRSGGYWLNNLYRSTVTRTVNGQTVTIQN